MIARVQNMSIVVCTYNRATSLRRTLDALDAQVTPPGLSWDLVVVDNNSTDGTRRQVDEFMASARIRMRYLFAAKQGVSHARNTGLACTEGEIVGFSDDDVDPAPDWVATIATVMTETGADIVGGRIRPAWQQPPPRWLEHPSFLYDRLAIMEHPTAAVVVDPAATPMIWGANMAFRRKVFDAVGAFDTRLGALANKLYRGEEVELIGRALAAGFRAVYDPRLVVSHRIGADRMRVRYFSRLYFHWSAGEAITQAPSRRRELAGVLLVRSASMAYRILYWLAMAARRRPDTLQRWLHCCAGGGFLWGTWKGYFARRHAAR